MAFYLLRLLSTKFLSRWLILSIDLLFSLFSSCGAVLLTAFVFHDSLTLRQFLYLGIVSLLTSAVSFYLCRTYQGVIRHASYTETGRIALASLTKVVLLLGITFFYFRYATQNMIFVTALLDLLITFFALIVIRVLIITVYYRLLTAVASGKDNLLIVKGSKNDNLFLSSPAPEVIGNYRVAGFLQANGTAKIKNLRIGGYPVYTVATAGDLEGLITRHLIKAVLFIDDYSLKTEKDRLVRYCEDLQLRMLTLPGVNEFSKGRVQYRQLPQVRVEDLLSRDEIRINLEQIRSELEGKTVLVTGAAGSIGSEICRQLSRFQLRHLVLFDSAETPMHNLRLELEEKYPGLSFTPILGDVRNKERVEAILERYHPQLIYHAAAYKHVPLMEENPCEAIRTNVYGTRVMADAAVKYAVEKFVMISTDKAVNPTNVMGASKRLAEMYVQSMNGAIRSGLLGGKTRFVTTRFGNVLGSNGSVIPLFREQIAKGGPVTVTHPDIIRYFMTIPEACRLVLEAGSMGQGGEIFVFDMGEPVKIVDLARRMITLAGLRPNKDIDIIFTGLRPGEKLYEELLSDGEQTLPTPHEKIRVAKVREFAYTPLANHIQELTDMAFTSEILTTVAFMKEIIPEFISKNSIFEKLDKDKQAV